MGNGPQRPGGISGVSPLIYQGSTPNMVIESRRPNAGDIAQYYIGHWWIIPISSSFPAGEAWWLASKSNNLATWKKIGSSSSGFFVNKIYLTTAGSGVYTPTPGMVQCYVECIGGGGSGNTINTACATGVSTFPGAGNLYTNAAGSAGAYTAKLYTADQIGASQSYVIGAGGIAPTADADADGNNGGDTTFMGMTAGGGLGAIFSSNGSSYEYRQGGVPSGGDINNNGGISFWQVIYNEANSPIPFSYESYAGSSFYSEGKGYITTTINATTGVSGSNGSGGGSVRYNTAAGSGLVIGGSGGDGLIVITEYIG